MMEEGKAVGKKLGDSVGLEEEVKLGEAVVGSQLGTAVGEVVG
jgi:hypothetical protein